eukprot:5560203-Alexandrium_andersonii.AAC.1
MRVEGMLHDHVVHMKKKVKRGNKYVRLLPKYTRTFTHALPDGNSLKVKGGTQLIDRFWRMLRARLRGNSARPGSRALACAIRAA